MTKTADKEDSVTTKIAAKLFDVSEQWIRDMMDVERLEDVTPAWRSRPRLVSVKSIAKLKGMPVKDIQKEIKRVVESIA